MIVFSGAIKFATFELSKVFVEARTNPSFHPTAQFLCAAGAMLACSVVLVPGEVLKTKLQGGVIASLFGGITQIFNTEGIAGLYAGKQVLFFHSLFVDNITNSYLI